MIQYNNCIKHKLLYQAATIAKNFKLGLSLAKEAGNKAFKIEIKLFEEKLRKVAYNPRMKIADSDPFRRLKKIADEFEIYNYQKFTEADLKERAIFMKIEEAPFGLVIKMDS